MWPRTRRLVLARCSDRFIQQHDYWTDLVRIALRALDKLRINPHIFQHTRGALSREALNCSSKILESSGLRPKNAHERRVELGGERIAP